MSESWHCDFVEKPIRAALVNLPSLMQRNGERNISVCVISEFSLYNLESQLKANK